MHGARIAKIDPAATGRACTSRKMPPPTGALVVALLQLSDTIAPGDRAMAARRMLDSAKKQGADVALLPELWGSAADGDASASPYAKMATALSMAIGVPYDPHASSGTSTGSSVTTTSTATSAVALFGMNGSLALTYAVKRGDPEGIPTCGDGREATATLVTAKGPVTVGVMLGTEFMYMQPARVQMVRGTEVLLNAVRLAGGIDPNHPYFEALQQDNFLYYAHANYASVNGRAAGGSGGGRVSQVAANATEQFVLLNVDLNGLRESRLTAGMWDGGFDFLSRRPFNYQPLCYAQSRSAHRAAGSGCGGGCDGVTSGGNRGDRGSGQGKLNATTRTSGSDGPVVRVAVLQMNAVDVPAGVDPVQAHTDRATTFVKLAKAKGADIVVFPEQWSVGYSRNWDHWKVPHYFDADSNVAVYSGYAAWAQRKDGPYVMHFRSLAKELGIAIAAAYTENVDGQPEPGDVQPPRNSVGVIDRNGVLLHNYAKVACQLPGPAHRSLAPLTCSTCRCIAQSHHITHTCAHSSNHPLAFFPNTARCTLLGLARPETWTPRVSHSPAVGFTHQHSTSATAAATSLCAHSSASTENTPSLQPCALQEEQSSFSTPLRAACLSKRSERSPREQCTTG